MAGVAKFTIPDDKCLVMELNEKNGGRHQSFVIENEDLVRAGTILSLIHIFPAEESFHTFIEHAVCLFTEETNYLSLIHI